MKNRSRTRPYGAHCSRKGASVFDVRTTPRVLSCPPTDSSTCSRVWAMRNQNLGTTFSTQRLGEKLHCTLLMLPSALDTSIWSSWLSDTSAS